jgi:hypothetical protein
MVAAKFAKPEQRCPEASVTGAIAVLEMRAEREDRLARRPTRRRPGAYTGERSPDERSDIQGFLVVPHVAALMRATYYILNPTADC